MLLLALLLWNFKAGIDREIEKEKWVFKQMQDFGQRELQALQRKGFEEILAYYRECNESEEDAIVFFPYCDGSFEFAYSGQLLREHVVELIWRASIKPNREHGSFEILIEVKSDGGEFDKLERIEGEVFYTPDELNSPQ